MSIFYADKITTVYSAQNNKIHSDLAALKKKLDRLRKKVILPLQFLFSSNCFMELSVEKQ